MSEAFSAKALAAYEAQGSKRGEDSERGLFLDECFVLDSEGVRAVGEAAGGGGPAFRIAETNFLSGVPGKSETLNCSLRSTGIQMALIAGTTSVDSDGQLERLRLGLKGVKEIEGTAPGLDAADVAAASGEGRTQLAWVSGGFLILVTGPEDKLGGAKGFAALSAAVEGVERTLSG